MTKRRRLRGSLIGDSRAPGYLLDITYLNENTTDGRLLLASHKGDKYVAGPENGEVRVHEFIPEYVLHDLECVAS